MYYAPHHSDGPATWGVTCTCREPTQLVMAFVAHYLALGASEVRLFLDQPQPDLEALLAQVPQVVVQVCDDAYWAKMTGKARPTHVEHRQLLNIYDAYHSTDAAWMAHFDADEFLHCDVAVADLLAAHPKEVDFVVVEPRERAFVEGIPQQGLFDGVFRQPVPHIWGKAAYLFGKAGRFMRQGVLGYPHGKCLMRTGQHLVPGIHTPRRPAEHRDIPLEGIKAQRARLLHFDGLTALHWSGKLLRAAASGADAYFASHKSRDRHRGKQILKMRRLGANLENALKMHEMLKTVPQGQLDRLRILSLVEDYHIDPLRDIAALGLDDPVDLSRKAFDQTLGQMMPQVGDWLADWEALLAAHYSATDAEITARPSALRP